MGEPRLSSGGEALLRFAGIAAGMAILLPLLAFSLLLGLLTGQAGAIAIIAAWYAALLGAFVYSVCSRRPLLGAAGFVLLLTPLIPLFIASTRHG